jgi:hypothetical protein
VTVRPIRLTPTEAELAVRVEVDTAAADAEVHGRLMGPRCRYGSTVEVAYPIRRLPPETGGPAARLGKVLIPEPSWWDPESPFLYGGPVDLWEGGQSVEVVRVRCGLHHASAAGGRLIWNGRPLELRAVVEAGVTRDQLAALRESGVNLVVMPADDLPGLWDEADEVGILLAGAAADAAARAPAHPPLHHPSLLGFVGPAAGVRPLYVTGGRGMLELVAAGDG